MKRRLHEFTKRAVNHTSDGPAYITSGRVILDLDEVSAVEEINYIEGYSVCNIMMKNSAGCSYSLFHPYEEVINIVFNDEKL